VLERDVKRREESGGGDSEDIRPVCGWQRREGGCMDITLD